MPPAPGNQEIPQQGLPPAGSVSSVEDFEYQIKYQRAFEAVLWNMPAVAIYSFRRAAFDNLGLKDNDIIAYSKPATPHLEAITANSTTPTSRPSPTCNTAPPCWKCPLRTRMAACMGRLSMPGNSP